jgi:hypothetical protein
MTTTTIINNKKNIKNLDELCGYRSRVTSSVESDVVIGDYSKIVQHGELTARDMAESGFWGGMWSMFFEETEVAWNRVYDNDLIPEMGYVYDLNENLGRNVSFDELHVWYESFREELFSWRKAYKVEAEVDYEAVEWWKEALRDRSEWSEQLISALRENKAFIVNADAKEELAYWGSHFEGWSEGPVNARCPLRITEIEFLPNYKKVNKDAAIEKSKSRKVPRIVAFVGFGLIMRSVIAQVVIMTAIFYCFYELYMMYGKM